MGILTWFRRRRERTLLWGDREVLVGVLRSREQLDVVLSCGFYHIPAELLKEAEAVRWVAVYQSRRFFGSEAGIWWYGKVRRMEVLPRYRIREIPKESEVPYCRLEVERWLPMARPVLPGDEGFVCFLTTRYQLASGTNIPGLMIEDREEFRFYERLMDWAGRGSGPKRYAFPLRWGSLRLRLRRGAITVRRDGESLAELTTGELLQKPAASFRALQEKLR